ncbi:tryptophan--tRNA ligase [Halosimplex rubrum]|uniref:Tryptophan--tRNA ligase n=1 Tax=Halosimplex rubrum TaxID=869889 RepID=A0A7D5SW60_9EURY|nr:tryptophan--tRNA ligase [Halosimplex rubrum]QLH76351.1 tryptophan--tRNA ligase [Halosimplex rubrum]
MHDDSATDAQPADQSADSTQESDGTDGDEPADADEFTVTPYDVDGTVDYDRLLEQFGADRLTDEQVERFPDHPMLRRRVFYAGRDADRYLAAAEAGDTHSIVTGIGPSGPMHLGHVLVFYLAKRLQDETGAHVYVPLSDDEKFYAKDLSFPEIEDATRSNLRDLLAVGFDPERTRIVVDRLDADAVYPQAARVAADITQSTVDATYGDPDNVGLSFYPAVQATHLLLPQLVHGRHPTLVPIAVDQDPHVRVCRDVAAKERFDVDKPGALLGKFLPALDGPGKMSSSSDAPAIELTDDRETVRAKIMQHAHSGGRVDIDDHREHGGDPSVDVAYQYLHTFFEPDDERVEGLAAQYRSGELLSGELKGIAAERIGDFLAEHRERRDALGDLESELAPYRLTEKERSRLRPSVFA